MMTATVLIRGVGTLGQMHLRCRGDIPKSCSRVEGQHTFTFTAV